MITLRNITLRRGRNILLENVNWTIYQKQHIGLIGDNGSGKSSLFAVLLQTLDIDAGEFDIPRQLRLAHVAQETLAYEKSALEFVLDGDTELRALENALLIAEENNEGTRIAQLHDQLSKIDAYTAKSRAAQLLNGLGFNHEEQQKSVNQFSGGWRVRLNLAQALMCRSDVLLLDEPTNHLDLDAVLWLEQWLMKYSGTLLLISHDREFLDNTVDHIVHISQQSLKEYAGNYSAFEQQRAAQILIQQAAYEKQQKHLAHLQSFVDRFRAKATKARQAQSRLKAIERMDTVSAVYQDSPFQFQFKEPKQFPNPLIRLEHANIAYGDRIILNDLNISIGPKDRIGILGPNGAGKTSLIKLLAGEISAASGKRETSSGLKIGYFAQHQVDQLLLQESPLYHLKAIAEHTPELELRKFLGSFGFCGDTVFEAVKNFSGGEKSRLALALIVWQQPNLLLLDEPTNHLDLDMRHALSLALQEYQGAMLLISHDRFLVKTTADQLLLVAENKLTEFSGDLQDYEKWLLEFRKQADKNAVSAGEKSDVSKKLQRQLDAQRRDQQRPLLQKIKKLEDELVVLEKKLSDIEMALADNAIYEPLQKQRLQEYLLAQADLKKQIETIELAWLEACEQKNLHH
jgi:ATP-binding cassette subfamily F protein 3